MDPQIDESLKEDKKILKAKQIKNLISLALLSNPEGISLDKLAILLGHFNVKQSNLLRWLQGKGLFGKILGSSFILERVEPEGSIKVRFPEDESLWLAFLFKNVGSLEFKRYENKILDALFNPERMKSKRDEYVLPHSGGFFSFIREDKELFVLYPLPTPLPSEIFSLKFEREIKRDKEGKIKKIGKWKGKINVNLSEAFLKYIDIKLIEELTGLKGSSWLFMDSYLVRCKKEILRRIEEKGGLLISELKEAGLYGPETETK
ncbi:MAG: hypothetical protein QW424_05210 [Candidatus Bathyarchaeia archaeon]